LIFCRFFFDFVAMGNCFGKPHVSSNKGEARTVELVERRPVAKVAPGANECISGPAAAELANTQSNETSSTDEEQTNTEPVSPSGPPAPTDLGKVTNLNDEHVHSSSPSVASNFSEGHADPEAVSIKNGPASETYLEEAPKLDDDVHFGSEFAASSISGEDVNGEPASATNGTQVYLGYLAKVNDEDADFGSEFGASSISEDDADPDAVIEERQTKSGESLRRSNSWAVIEQ
jgi:hypothetical protein